MDSGDSSSPHCRDADGDNNVSSEETPPQQPPSRVKLMCSYGGRIQPRPHDNQLAYFGGDTKLLAVDRSIHFPAIIAKLAALHGSASADLIRIKYQLPGEDLDSLISVSNDEDLEQMMIEYDRLFLCSGNGKPSARLRLFLFPRSSIGSGMDQDKKNGKDPLKSNLLPDLLSGIASLSSKDPAPDNFPVEKTLSEKSEQGKEDKSSQQIAVQTERILEVQIPDNQIYPPTNMQQHGIEEPLSRVYQREYYPPGVQEQPRFPIPTSTAQIQLDYWSDQFPLRQFPMYLYPAARPAYYQNPFPRFPPVNFPASFPANFPAMYGVAPPQHQNMSMVSPAAPAPSGLDAVTTAGLTAYDGAVRPVFYANGGTNSEAVTTKPI